MGAFLGAFIRLFMPPLLWLVLGPILGAYWANWWQDAHFKMVKQASHSHWWHVALPKFWNQLNCDRTPFIDLFVTQ